MRRKQKIMLAVIIAGFLAIAGLYGIEAVGRESGGNNISWFRQAEETFYLNPGMGEKTLSRNQWDLFQKEMKNMPPEELSSFRLGMHKILMEDAHARHIDVPHHVSPYDENKRDVKLNTDNNAFIRLVAGTTTGAKSGRATSITRGSISAGAATGLSGGSTPVTGSSGAASGSLGGTASMGSGSTPVTGSAGIVSGLSGGTAAFGAFGQAAPANLTSTPVTGSSGSVGGTAALSSFNPVAAFSTTSTPTAQQTANAAAAALLAASSPPVITTTPNQSDISPVVPAMGLEGRAPINDCGPQAAMNIQYIPVPVAAPSQVSRPSVSSGIVTSRDADRMFGSNPTTSTRRSVGTYDDSRGAIFHYDFEIGGGNRDRDRNDW